MKVVLDAYAVLAHLEGEEEGKRVARLLEEAESGRAECFISVINVAEVLYVAQRRRGRKLALDVYALIRSWPVKVVEVNEEILLNAADIKARHKVSLADAFAAATAKVLDASVMTGDEEFEELEKEVPVIWLRKGD